MTQENKETDNAFRYTDKHTFNSLYGKMGKVIRSTIQFVPQQDTTETRLKDIRERMIFTRAKNTIRRTGWYFTESYPPCGADHYPKMGIENIGM